MCLVQIKQAQIKFPLSGFWTVYLCSLLFFLPSVSRVRANLTQLTGKLRVSPLFLPFVADRQFYQLCIPTQIDG